MKSEIEYRIVEDYGLEIIIREKNVDDERVADGADEENNDVDDGQ